MADAGFYRLKQIIGDPKNGIDPIIPIGRTGWLNGVADGRFPQPIKFGARVVMWKAEDINQLIAGTWKTKVKASVGRAA